MTVALYVPRTLRASSATFSDSEGAVERLSLVLRTYHQRNSARKAVI
jgi:hypothetical protein